MNFIPQYAPHFTDNAAYELSKYMLAGGWVTEYKQTKRLERKLAKFTGAKYATLTTSGTTALTLALLASDIKRGDRFLVPDATMIATANAGVLLGAEPVLVDIDPITLCLDLKKAKSAITKTTKALIYVSLNGRSGNMTKVVQFCKQHNLFLIEDAAQSLGSYFGKKHLGTFGSIGCLSFSSPKIISTGQGGALLTSSRKLNNKIKLLKDFGRKKGGEDFHPYLGWNFKFTDIQAVLGLSQFRLINRRIKRKKDIFRRYRDGLSSISQVNIIPTNLKYTTPWFVDIYVDLPDKLARFLKKNGIGTRRVYPPIHSQKIYRNKWSKKSFPVAEKYASKGLWLPSSPRLTNREIDYVVSNIKKYYSKFKLKSQKSKRKTAT